TGNLLLERLYLEQLREVSSISLLGASLRVRLAANALETGNYNETIKILNSAFGARVNAAPAAVAWNHRQIQALMAEALLGRGQTERAREIFTRLIDIETGKPDDVSVTSAERLDRLDAGDMPETEHLRRASIYQSGRRFSDARAHYRAVIATFSGSPSVPDAILQIGRGFVQETDFIAAIGEFERIREQHPASGAAKEALLQSASAYARVGKPREAIVRYQQYIDGFPGDEKLDRAYLNIVDILRDQGADAEASRWCAKAQKVFKGKVPEALALFAEARIYVAKENWAEALVAIEKLSGLPNLGGAAVPGGTSIPEITFLHAFALEQLSRYPEAIDGYLSIHDGRDEYYGWRATQRLASLSRNEASRSSIDQKLGLIAAGMSVDDPQVARKNASAVLRLTDSTDLRQKAIAALKVAIAKVPAYQLPPELKDRQEKKNKTPKQAAKTSAVAETLLELGLFDEAAPELEAGSKGRGSADTTPAFTLASYYNRGDRGDRAIAFMEPFWRNVPADYPIELIPGEQLELLYPTPYSDLLVRDASMRDVDPRLMLAVMRQESRFQPDARSGAAARGLMQFIGRTAARISGEIGREHFDEDDLYDPATSILFGLQYLTDLFRVFPNQPEAVAASYNGGDDNMKRWLTRSRSNLPERYVPEISYGQSKDYVYKVMANYRMYQYIYDEQLRRR
ncbi:MAG: transglycosylase SLT domain-containing protein, partial [Pyrinomonadaceae bacterium]